MGGRRAGADPGSDFGFRASFGSRISAFGFQARQPYSTFQQQCSKAALEVAPKRGEHAWSPGLRLWGIQGVDGVAEAAFDGAVPFGREDLVAVQLADVEAVEGRAALGADLGGGDVQGQLGERLRDGVEQADAVLGLDLDEGAGVGGVVVEADLGGDLFAGVGLVERAGDLLDARSRRGSPLPRR